MEKSTAYRSGEEEFAGFESIVMLRAMLAFILLNTTTVKEKKQKRSYE